MAFLLHALSLVFGILLIYRAYQIYRAGKESLTWKPTTAYIISADIGKMKSYGFLPKMEGLNGIYGGERSIFQSKISLVLKLQRIASGQQIQ